MQPPDPPAARDAVPSDDGRAGAVRGRPRRMRSLRGVLLGLLVGPLLPLAVISSALVWTQWDQHRAEVYEGLARDAATIRVAIDQEVEIGKAILDTLGASALIDAGDWEGFRRLAIEALRDRPESWIALGDATGLQRMRTFEPVPATPTMNPNAFAQRHVEVEWNGHRIPLSTQGLSERVVRTGRLSNTGLYFGAAIRRPAVAIGVPVMRAGAVSHVLILGFAPDRLAMLVEQSAREGRRVSLVDASGRVIVGSRDAANSTGRPVSDGLRELIAQRDEGFREGPNRLGEDIVAAFRRSALTDWTVVVSSPRATAFAPSWRVAGAWSALVLALLLASAWGSRALWLRLAPALVAMGRSARAIQRGERPDLPVSGIAEIDRLGALLREAASAEARSRDETLRRAVAEESMRAREASERRLRAVLDNVDAFVAVLDADGTLREVNRTAVEPAALTRDDVIGRPFWDAPWWSHDPEVRDRIRDAVARAAAGERVREDVHARSGVASTVTVDLQVSPLRDADGTIAMLIACGVDVTERERTERALREADRQKDEFLAILSHELRNPLAPIRSASHVIRMRAPQDPAIAQAGQVIERQVRQMVRLVDDLLEIARITQGRVGLRPRAESLEDVVATAIEAARPAIEAAGHRLEVRWPDEPLTVHADAQRLSQAVLNVLHNAGKYTPPGGRIAVSVGRDGERARVSIEDDGMGMDADTLPRIFDMFVQGPREPGDAAGGLGIGLALARRLVDMHGGAIGATSEGPGRGSRFDIVLPLLGAAAERSPDAAPQRRAAARRLLVVDDNLDAAATLQLALEIDGHAVRAVHDGRGALAAVAADRPDAVLLDIGLPDIDGFEVARRLKATYGAACPRLIALSGWGQDSDKRRARELGFERHFTKPVDPSTIAALLDREPAEGAETA